jgi:hypothetical protein
MVLQRTLVSGGLVSLLAIVASITAAAAPVMKQRIAIEERSKLGSFSGTFTLIPLGHRGGSQPTLGHSRSRRAKERQPFEAASA